MSSSTEVGCPVEDLAFVYTNQLPSDFKIFGTPLGEKTENSWMLLVTLDLLPISDVKDQLPYPPQVPCEQMAAVSHSSI